TIYLHTRVHLPCPPPPSSDLAASRPARNERGEIETGGPAVAEHVQRVHSLRAQRNRGRAKQCVGLRVAHLQLGDAERDQPALRGDRKSTRLNSSHGSISYAVF